MVSVINSPGNTQIPYAVSEVFVPDQLIAGDKKPITDNANVVGSAALKRGTVLGQIKFTTPVTSAGKTYAKGTIVVAAVPTTGDTLTVNGTVITFTTKPTDSNELPPAGTLWIESTTALMATSLCAYLANSTDANIALMTYTVSGSTITATALAIGTGPNAYTLATSRVASFTVPATLNAGTAGTGNTGTTSIGTVSFGKDAKVGNYLIVQTATSQTGAFTVYSPTGEEIGTGTVGTAFTSSHINFTLTAGGTATAGDSWVVSNGILTGAGNWQACVSTAVDGSEIPTAVLADDCDPTVGGTVAGTTAVQAGIYIEAELNGNALIYDSSLTLPYIKQEFRKLGLNVKTSVSAADPS